MQNSKTIMADICQEYLKVAKGRKFDFYRLFSSVPDKLYLKFKKKKSENEIEVCYAADHLKVSNEIAITYYGGYRIGFYRPGSINAYNSDEVIHDLKLSQDFRDILRERHKLTIEDLEKLIDSENESLHNKTYKRSNRSRWEAQKPQQGFKTPPRYNMESKFDAETRVKELKVLMQKSHPDKGGDLSLFIECSKELAKIRS